MEKGKGSGDNMKMKSAKCKSQNKFCILHFALLLPPSLRERKRYLVCEVISEREIDKRELLKEIRDSTYSLYGDVGASESRIWLIEYDKKKDADTSTDVGVGILRCAHDKVEEVRAALACIHSVNEARVGIRVVGISGTIKGATRLTKSFLEKSPILSTESQTNPKS
jgi:ribonuclease P/MRP protein subunit POP5